MRVFIAIEFTDEMKEYIENKQQIVKNNSKKGNFSRKENFHLTLKFIGEVDDNKIQGIKKAIDVTANRVHPFSLMLGELGEFPRKNKKIIWIGISHGKKDLEKLFNCLEANLEKEGFTREERGLKPHITIGREIRLDKLFYLLSDEISSDSREIQVGKISLMESKRVEGVLRYIPIYTKSLNKDC